MNYQMPSNMPNQGMGMPIFPPFPGGPIQIEEQNEINNLNERVLNLEKRVHHLEKKLNMDENNASYHPYQSSMHMM